MEEIEVKFLNINPEIIEKKLVKLGAKKDFDRIFRRRVFDYPDLRLDKMGAWIRLRDEGDKITLTFKQRVGMQGHDGKTNDRTMEEIEVMVNDFEKTAELLTKIGFKEKFYEENRRIKYHFGSVEFAIDFWPALEPYLEIEGSSWEAVDKAIGSLGLDPEQKRIFSTFQIYQLKGINENDYQEITFEKMLKKENKK